MTARLVLQRGRGCIVRIRAYSSHGHTVSGIGILLTRRPIQVLTAAHVLTPFEGDTAPALSLDGQPHQLRRITPFPGLLEDLFVVIETTGPLASGKKCARLPRTPIPLVEGQGVTVDKDEAGITRTHKASVMSRICDGDDEAVVLDARSVQGDSGSPVFAEDALVGVCQASGGDGSSGTTIVSPLTEEALAILNRLVPRRRVPRWVVVGAALTVVCSAALIVLPTLLGRKPQQHPVFPEVTIWPNDPGTIHYEPGDTVSIAILLRTTADVTLVEQLPDGTQEKLIDDKSMERGTHSYRATLAQVVGEVRFLIAAAAMGKTSTDAMSVRVGTEYVSPSGSGTETAAAFADSQLEKVVRSAIGQPTGVLTRDAVAGLKDLPARGYGITDLSGIEACVNLVSLDLGENKLTDLEPLAKLTELRQLKLDRNGTIADIARLRPLAKLQTLDITYNRISDLEALESLKNLEWLFLGGNPIKSHSLAALKGLVELRLIHAWGANLTDMSAVASLALLQELHVEDNAISDARPASHLRNLASLCLRNNKIKDISSLAANPGLGSGDDVDLRENSVDLSPASAQSAAVRALQERGVNLLTLPQHAEGASSISPIASEQLVTSGVSYRTAAYTGEVFLNKTLSVSYQGGAVVLSHDPGGAGDIMVDDVLELTVEHEDGASAHQIVNFTNECMHAVAPLPPCEITGLFEPGINTVHFALYDGCGGNAGCTRIYLVVTP